MMGDLSGSDSRYRVVIAGSVNNDFEPLKKL